METTAFLLEREYNEFAKGSLIASSNVERVSNRAQKAPAFPTISAEAIQPLLQTKLSIPQRRVQLVPRPRLLRSLARGTARALTLICAPAGYGKTTELEVLHLLVEGCSNQEIVETLILSEGTVKFHVHHVLEKLQVRTRSQAIAIARKQNLL
jgi:ATP/maltotriose-dependent transcriptional regulator MalT